MPSMTFSSLGEWDRTTGEVFWNRVFPSNKSDNILLQLDRLSLSACSLHFAHTRNIIHLDARI